LSAKKKIAQVRARQPAPREVTLTQTSSRAVWISDFCHPEPPTVRRKILRDGVTLALEQREREGLRDGDDEQEHIVSATLKSHPSEA
jgi:hypothetical protein